MRAVTAPDRGRHLAPPPDPPQHDRGRDQQDREDPGHFVLVEVYKTADAPAAHKETAHYAKWRDTVADMMAVPRSSTKFETLYPEDDRWNS